MRDRWWVSALEVSTFGDLFGLRVVGTCINLRWRFWFRVHVDGVNFHNGLLHGFSYERSDLAVVIGTLDSAVGSAEGLHLKLDF
jgi:hypothetical protein